MNNPALQLIAGFEGFREKPYWDVNAYRTGYGSDTITRADGSIVPVSQGMAVSQEDALRDLNRRVSNEFAPSVIGAIGQDRWNALNPNQQASLTSLAYNYGAGAWNKGLAPVAQAIISGADPSAVSQHIAALGSHNDGINANRRAKEASIYAGGTIDAAPLPNQPGLMSSVTGQPAESVKILGFDTGKTQDQWSEAVNALNQPAPQIQAPQVQTGPGYVKQHDSLTRALEAFNQTRKNRR